MDIVDYLESERIAQIMPPVGTIVSLVIAIDGKLNSIEGQLAKVVIGHKYIAGYVLNSYAPSGDGDGNEKRVTTFVHAEHVVSSTWSPDDYEKSTMADVANIDFNEDDSDMKIVKFIKIDEQDDIESDNDEQKQTFSEFTNHTDEAAVSELRNVLDEAIAATPRAAIVSAISKSFEPLRDVARKTARMTE